jgi:hypothetical protein
MVVVVASSCGGGGGGWTVEVEAPLGGGGGSHTMNPVTGDPHSGSLVPDLGARVPVGLPCALTWIYTVCLGAGLKGESSTGKISMGSSSSSSSPAVIPSLPLPPSESVMKDPTASTQPGRGKSPNHGWRKGFPSDFSERWPGLRVPSTNIPVSRGREVGVVQEP